MGFVCKCEPTQSVLTAIRQVLAGKLYLNAESATYLVARYARGRSSATTTPIDQLSDRELTIYRRIGQGQSVAEIAAALRISINTVYTHLNSIKLKLSLQNRRELFHHAVRWDQPGSPPQPAAVIR